MLSCLVCKPNVRCTRKNAKQKTLDNLEDFRRRGVYKEVRVRLEPIALCSTQVTGYQETSYIK